MNETPSLSSYVELAADIVSAYVSNNTVAVQDLPNLIHEVHNALVRINSGKDHRVIASVFLSVSVSAISTYP